MKIILITSLTPFFDSVWKEMVYGSINRPGHRYLNYAPYNFRSISTKFVPFLLIVGYIISNLESSQEKTYIQRSYNFSFNLFCNKHKHLNVYTNSIINGCCYFFDVPHNLVDTQKNYYNRRRISLN